MFIVVVVFIQTVKDGEMSPSAEYFFHVPQSMENFVGVKIILLSVERKCTFWYRLSASVKIIKQF